MALLLLAVVMVGTLGAGQLTTAATKNLAFRALSREIASSASDCSQSTLGASLPLLQDVLRRQPGDVTTWIALLRLKGMTDRSWIVDRLSDNGVTLASIDRQAIGAAKAELAPNRWAVTIDWNQQRCQGAWDAWTVGLIEATSGNWQEAVAAYQTGIGLALGRVPDAILEEYYRALGRSRAEQAGASHTQQLLAAKYLALGGDDQGAARLFQTLATKPELTPEQRCEAEASLIWLQSSGTQTAPPWPVSARAGAACTATPAPNAAPDWPVAAYLAASSANHDATPVGFDLDRDVLEAGAEVIGLVYWRLPDGSFRQQRFRQPNLWPNSGNSWRASTDTWACLPGYLEPGWISPCASGVETEMSASGMGNDVGHVRVQSEAKADTYVTSLSVPLPGGRQVVYSGRWRVSGNLPSPHLAYDVVSMAGERYESGQRYEVVLPLPAAPSAGWINLAGIAPALAADADVQQWIRPQVGHASGDVWFDDVCSFTLPDLMP